MCNKPKEREDCQLTEFCTLAKTLVIMKQAVLIVYLHCVYILLVITKGLASMQLALRKTKPWVFSVESTGFWLLIDQQLMPLCNFTLSTDMIVIGYNAQSL